MLFRLAPLISKAAVVVVVLAWLAPLVAHAQLATVRGRVADAADDQPLAGAAVLLTSLDDGRRLGTAADSEGYFVLSRITPGRYRLEASFVGYLPQADTLALEFGERHTLALRLARDEAEMGEVVVESERESGSNARLAGTETVRPSALARLPSPGVSADLANYIQTLPGVVTSGDRGGQLFVRGGTPTQNLVLLDGMPVLQPFHIVGFYSAFPADLLAYADVHRGGFAARYGGRLSSVIDVATRNGNKRRVAGAASLAPFLGAVRLEVPIVQERVSLMASVRESVIERIGPEIGLDLPYRFGDRFGKFHAFLNRTSSFSLTALQTFDEGDVADTEGRPNLLRWSNLAVGGQYIYLPEDYPVMTRLSLFGSRVDSRYRPFGARQRRAELRTAGTEIRFTYYLRAVTLNFALFAQTHRLAFTLEAGDGLRLREIEEFLSEGGGFIEASIDLDGGLHLEPGLRLHSFPSRSKMKLEPRMRAAWQPGGTRGAHVFSLAAGIYHQEITGLYNTRDVTDAFVSWIPSPENEEVPRAIHALAGWQGRLGYGVTLGAEVYFKDLANLTFAAYDDALDTGLSIDRIRGEAYGLDLKVDWARPSVRTSLSYSLARVAYHRQASLAGSSASFDPHFSPPHDRRHQVVALLHLSRGPYAVQARWHFGSGLPFSRAQGFYDSLRRPRPGDRDFHTQPGVPVIVRRQQIYDARLPAYHRLDLSAERRFQMKRVAATLRASLINVYDRANLFDYDLFAGRRVNQLPLIPSLGLHVEVK